MGTPPRRKDGSPVRPRGRPPEPGGSPLITSDDPDDAFPPGRSRSPRMTDTVSRVSRVAFPRATANVSRQAGRYPADR
ncbi:hypothetical protein GCM10018953_26160 [Streptosporangium nondiastaticum]